MFEQIFLVASTVVSNDFYDEFFRFATLLQEGNNNFYNQITIAFAVFAFTVTILAVGVHSIRRNRNSKNSKMERSCFW